MGSQGYPRAKEGHLCGQEGFQREKNAPTRCGVPYADEGAPPEVLARWFLFRESKGVHGKKLEYTEVQILHEPICRMPHSLKFMHGNTDKHTPLPTDEVEGHNVGGTRSLQEGKPPHPNSLHQHRLVLFYFCNRDSFYTMQLVQGRGNRRLL